MPLLSAHSNSACFEVDQVNRKDRETGDSGERLDPGPLWDQTTKLFIVELPSKKRDLLQLRHFDLVVAATDTYHHATRRKAKILEISSRKCTWSCLQSQGRYKMLQV
jgi:hypothetical protein